jgi:drug/metabolite transporter superfamily protein YnfA
MSLFATLIILIVAAILEAGGDALVRNGLHASTSVSRIVFYLSGGLVLFGYGYMVNRPPWDFGRLLGLYVVFFFIAAQLISYFFFHTVPARSVLIGGLFIVVGGAIITIGNSN